MHQPIQLTHLCPKRRKVFQSHSLFDLLQFKDSETAQNMKLSASKASYMLNHGLEPYFERLTLQAIIKCDFLVAQFDKSQ